MSVAIIKKRTSAAKRAPANASNGSRDLLMVNSVAKAFRVLRVFDCSRPSLSLSEIAEIAGLDVSATQRFTHTLLKLGYLEKDAASRRFGLTVKVLELGQSYASANPLVKQAIPYLLHLNKDTEETINLTVLDETSIVFIVRFLSRHVFNTDVVIGTRLPAYCTAPGRAILSRLPSDEAEAIVSSSDLRPLTAHTPRTVADVMGRVARAAAKGYALQVEECFYGDMSVSAAVIDGRGRPVGAINIGVATTRYTPQEMEVRFAPMVVAAARSVSDISL
ncbi:IclR family transcriptional regulator [Mesorhizobium sp. M0228]|uniref:IclR family transcriptional regulator n=1 Tax=Mesorhizobium sp. M0228 TaxID=2956923 RepID=UPI00333BCC75